MTVFIVTTFGMIRQWFYGEHVFIQPSVPQTLLLSQFSHLKLHPVTSVTSLFQCFCQTFLFTVPTFYPVGWLWFYVVMTLWWRPWLRKLFGRSPFRSQKKFSPAAQFLSSISKWWCAASRSLLQKNPDRTMQTLTTSHPQSVTSAVHKAQWTGDTQTESHVFMERPLVVEVDTSHSHIQWVGWWLYIQDI